MEELSPIEALVRFQERLKGQVGRHIYAFVGEVEALQAVEEGLGQLAGPQGRTLPPPVRLSLVVLGRLSQARLQTLVRRERFSSQAIYQELNRAFKEFINEHFQREEVLIAKDFELLFYYGVELGLVRSLSTDRRHTAFLVPGRAEGGAIRLYAGQDSKGYDFYPGLVNQEDIWLVVR